MATVGKLSKTDQKNLAKHAGALRTAFDAATALGAAEHDVSTLDLFKKLSEQVTRALEAVNYAGAEAVAFIQGLLDDQQGLFDEKSDKWQEGGRGEAVRSWLEDLDGLTEFGDAETEVLESKDFTEGQTKLLVLCQTSAFDLTDVEDYLDRLEALEPEAS